MRMRLVSWVVDLLLVAGLSVVAGAQGPLPGTPTTAGGGGAGSIRGRVVLANGSAINQSVKVNLLNIRGTRDTTISDNTGQFEFRGLPPGEYTVEVEADKLRFDPSTERTQVFRGSLAVVTVTLKEKSSSESKKASSVISVGEIGADVPDKAKKEFARATKAYKEGRATESIDHLRQAIAVYPKFLSAHNDLGAQLLEQGSLDEAASELRRAIEIDAKAFNPYLNLGIVLVKQKRFAEAADTLRQALSLESNWPAAKLHLGVALMNLKEFVSAERELHGAYELGGRDFSIALFYLGELYIETGKRAQARQALEAYVREASDGANAAQARKLIAMLQ